MEKEQLNNKRFSLMNRIDFNSVIGIDSQPLNADFDNGLEIAGPRGTLINGSLCGRFRR
jgi:hypothetical protein